MSEGVAFPSLNRPSDEDGQSTGSASADIREIAAGLFARHEAASLSPSLWQDREEPAFEFKFQVDQTKARDLATWAAEHLNLDPHADPQLENSYRVHGLYFDTPFLDVYHRSPGFKKRKFRLRRYGEGATIFLEQKRKSAGRVAKRRVPIGEGDLARLREPYAEVEWPGVWFHRRISQRQLQPSCLISYCRQAYFGHNAEGPLRMTLDRQVRAGDANGWSIATLADGGPTLTEQVLLELKFRRHLPALFKALMQDFALTPGPLSKYRLAIQSLGRANLGAGGGPDA
ncbi:MAG: polyphosphate polymerase domain-containing protein [Planctomycetes bacterium]|nr:polyphosphate polymerase domain-containing protein [Planctomycetota bacterium]